MGVRGQVARAGSLFPFHPVDPRNQTQVAVLGGKHPYLLYLIDPLRTSLRVKNYSEQPFCGSPASTGHDYEKRKLNGIGVLREAHDWQIQH